MSVQSAQDLFVSELKKTYYTEQKLLEALEELSATSSSEELQEGFAEHRNETEEHVDRLESVFEQLDEAPEEMPDPVVDAMMEAHESFMEMDPSEDALNRHNIAAGQKTEHYEIAAYDDLLTLAHQLEYEEVTDHLEETLEEEKQELETLEQKGKEFDYEEIEE